MTQTIIDKLEREDGPDRGIDRAIAKVAVWHRVEPRFTRSKHGAWISPDDWVGEYSDGSPITDSLHGTTMHREVPAYTASIDAAMTLVPEGVNWTMGGGGKECAIVIISAGQGLTDAAHGFAATPALALCIAALRARSQGGE